MAYGDGGSGRKEYDNTNRGVLFVNMKKDKNNPKDNKPDRNGSINIQGQEYWISGWIALDDKGNPKKDKDGNPYMRLSVQLKEGQRQGDRNNGRQDDRDDRGSGRQRGRFDDDIPF